MAATRTGQRRCDGPPPPSPRNPPINILARAEILAAIAVSGLPATARQHGTATNHALHGAPASSAEIDAIPSPKAFKAADDCMMAPRTGNTEQDFVASMIPHHQGAIDRAKVELQYRKDPTLRKLAAGVIAAQEKRIAETQERAAGGWKSSLRRQRVGLFLSVPKALGDHVALGAQ